MQYAYNSLGYETQITDELGRVYENTPTGRRTKITELDGRTSDYTYNDRYWLTSEAIADATNGNYNASYSYDTVGNRLQGIEAGVTTQYQYDDNDRITQQGGVTYSYDDNGNTLQENDQGLITSYGYNSQDQIVTYDHLGRAIEFEYDPSGIRESQSDGADRTEYVLDINRSHAQVLAELGNGTVQVQYNYGDDLISQSYKNSSQYFHVDGLGSTRVLTGESGNSTDTYSFTGFGELLNREGVTDNDFLYAGEQFDENLNRYYLRARFYDQGIGRFSRMDSWLGNGQSPVTLNKYLYANSDPVQYTDPSGYFGLASFGAASSVRNTLSNLQIESGVNFGSAALESDSPSAGSVGWGVIAGLSPGVVRVLSKTIKSKFIGNGKVAYNKKFQPLKKEINAAEYLAEKEGARIYIRGGNSTQGADFFLNGKKWELKTLNSPSARAVRNAIHKSVVGRKQSNLVIIDGRAGLDWKTFEKGLANANRDGAYPARVKVILGNGDIREWP